MEYPATREEAKRTGAKFYFTGKPCTRGHVAPRKTKGCCTECMREDWVTDNERRKGLPKSEASKAAGKRYYERNKDLVKAKAAARPTETKNKFKRNHKVNNPEYYRVLGNARRRRHREATPAWLTKEQREDIKQLYTEAQKITKLTGVRYEVDHIIPLINDIVCGLHVPWNLQVIPKTDNLKKANKIACEPVG
jgi:hypothetical protein